MAFSQNSRLSQIKCAGFTTRHLPTLRTAFSPGYLPATSYIHCIREVQYPRPRQGGSSKFLSTGSHSKKQITCSAIPFPMRSGLRKGSKSQLLGGQFERTEPWPKKQKNLHFKAHFSNKVVEDFIHIVLTQNLKTSVAAQVLYLSQNGSTAWNETMLTYKNQKHLPPCMDTHTHTK